MGMKHTNHYKKFIMFERTFKEIRVNTPYDRYTWKINKHEYHVDVRVSDGDKSYHINWGFAAESTKYHKAIENHFEI